MESAGLVGNLASGLYPRNMDRKRIVGDESGEADALHDQLIKNMERSTFVMNTSRFLPEASLERIITRETIALVLPERLFGVSEEDIAIISEKMIKIFAVLIYIKIDAMSMIHLLNLLKDHHINDSNLPISQGEFFRFFRSLAHGENTNPPSLRRHVRSLHPEIEQFCEAQWIFIAPVLFNDGRECQFQRKHVLPFIEKEMPVYSKSDHRSYIYYKIHKDYLKDVSRRRLNYPLTVAVKDVTRGRTCYQHRPNEWKAEIKRLMAVEKLEQEHIVKFYAAIVQYKSTSPRFYLMFERADGGNLLDFWKAFPSTSGFATQTVQETFLQISGLVKALHAAHRGIQGVSMCHGNLKPAHILWIRGPGIGMFKLGGWEENRFQSPKSQYATPDSEALSPENDLWAFGCILLEMLIWMLYDAAELHRLKASIINGHDELELFDRDRLDFGKKRIEQRTPVIVAYYHAARHWISYMEGDPAFRLGQTAADDLFEIVKADLLVLDRTKTSVWTFLRKFRSSGWLARFKLVRFPGHLLLIIWLLVSLTFALNLYTRKSRAPVLFDLFNIFILILEVWVILPPLRHTTQLDNGLDLQSSSRIDIGDLSDRFDYITAGRDPHYWVLHSFTTEIPPLSLKSITTNEVHHPKTNAYTATIKNWKQSLLVLKKSPAFLFHLLQYKSWKRSLRPNVKWGYRRIEWRCDCGVDLYADLPRRYGSYIDKLASSLQGPGPKSPKSSASADPASQDTKGRSSTSKPALGTSVLIDTSSRNTQRPAKRPADRKRKHRKGESDDSDDQSDDTGEDEDKDNTSKRAADVQMYLALCINTGGMYKRLAEIDVSSTTSDAALFLEMRTRYEKTRGWWSRFNWLVRPMTIEFIEFKFWNFKESWITVCNRPSCIPPQDSKDYKFQPRTLQPPPMPPQVYLHYLRHGDGDLSPLRNDWIEKLPKRLTKHDSPCYAYGMHIIEGPHKAGIFVITMIILVIDVAVSVGWSAWKHDVQGGTGIGALIVACWGTFLTAWIFWRSN